MGLLNKDMTGMGGLFGLPSLDPDTQGAIDSYASMPRGPVEQKRGGFLGSGYDGEDIMAMLLRAASIAQGDYGAGAQFGANIGARARAEAEAAAQERLHQQRRMEGREDKSWEWQNKPSDPYRTEDNVGNVWEIGSDGQQRRIFTDTAPKYYVQGDQAIQIQNPFADGSETPTTNSLGGLPHVSDEASYAAVPAGRQYVTPTGEIRTKAGGGVSNGPGGFPDIRVSIPRIRP